MNLWQSWFSFPNGGIWSNLIASVIVAVIAWFWKIKPHFQKIHKHNEEMKRRYDGIARRRS